LLFLAQLLVDGSTASVDVSPFRLVSQPWLFSLGSSAWQQGRPPWCYSARFISRLYSRPHLSSDLRRPVLCRTSTSVLARTVLRSFPPVSKLLAAWAHHLPQASTAW